MLFACAYRCVLTTIRHLMTVTQRIYLLLLKWKEENAKWLVNSIVEWKMKWRRAKKKKTERQNVPTVFNCLCLFVYVLYLQMCARQFRRPFQFYSVFESVGVGASDSCVNRFDGGAHKQLYRNFTKIHSIPLDSFYFYWMWTTTNGMNNNRLDQCWIRMLAATAAMMRFVHYLLLRRCFTLRYCQFDMVSK